MFQCERLVDVMNGSIYLDSSYNSGFSKDFPGACFVIDLKRAPLPCNNDDDDVPKTSSSSNNQNALLAPPQTSLTDSSDVSSSRTLDFLPQNLSVLLVDDDRILRKQATRAIRRVLPDAHIQEAASGEAALVMVEDKSFNIIFMDQYMESVEKSLLGTETVRAMRVKGVKSIICGLSANQMRENFIHAGAQSFWLKPFKCKEEELRLALIELLNIDTVIDKMAEAAANAEDDIV